MIRQKYAYLLKGLMNDSICLSIMGILFFPIYWVWYYKESVPDSESWYPVYVLHEEDFRFFVFAFCMLFALLLFVKNKSLRLILKILLVPLAGICSLLGMASGLPSNDGAGGVGGLLLLLILPQFLAYCFADYQIKHPYVLEAN